MNWIKRILQSIFYKKQYKEIEAPKEEIIVNKRQTFANSIKISECKRKRAEIETLICEGDGTGIQGKISY